MKNLIVYAGGKTTKKCANIFAEKLENVKVVNLKEEIPNINEYDSIIIGSRIRIGNLNKTAKQFINENKDALLNKKVVYYICCTLIEESNQYFETNFDQELLNNAICYNAFSKKLNNDEEISEIVMKLSEK